MNNQTRQLLTDLRRKLLDLYQRSREELSLFLSDTPMTRGTVYPLRRKCGKAGCRCTRGQLHETLVLTASMGGKTRLWKIPAEEVEEVRERTRAYRRFRQERAVFIERWARQGSDILKLIDSIEQVRTRQP